MKFGLPILSASQHPVSRFRDERVHTFTRVTGHTINTLPITGPPPAYGFCSVSDTGEDNASLDTVDTY